MRNTIKAMIVLTLVGVVTLAVWQWGESAGGRPAPVLDDGYRTTLGRGVENIPSSEAGSPRIRSHSSRGSAGAVETTRLFKEAGDCLLYHSALDELAGFRDDDRLDDLSNETLATLEVIDATSGRYLSIVRETQGRCAGSDREALAQVYQDAILRAALMGDPDAQSCFVIGGLSPLKITSAASLAYLVDRYVTHAPAFTQSALERSDARVAANALYRYVASPSLHHTLLDDMPKADPYLTWKMAHLALLRALPEQRAHLKKRLKMFEELDVLQPDEISQGVEWARATYEREFADQPPVNLNSQEPCYSSSGLAP